MNIKEALESTFPYRYDNIESALNQLNGIELLFAIKQAQYYLDNLEGHNVFKILTDHLLKEQLKRLNDCSG